MIMTEWGRVDLGRIKTPHMVQQNLDSWDGTLRSDERTLFNHRSIVVNTEERRVYFFFVKTPKSESLFLYFIWYNNFFIFDTPFYNQVKTRGLLDTIPGP